MIVICPQCATKYNLPDANVRQGAKLRCSLCQHLFVLQVEVQAQSLQSTPPYAASSLGDDAQSPSPVQTMSSQPQTNAMGGLGTLSMTPPSASVAASQKGMAFDTGLPPLPSPPAHGAHHGLSGELGQTGQGTALQMRQQMPQNQMQNPAMGQSMALQMPHQIANQPPNQVPSQISQAASQMPSQAMGQGVPQGNQSFDAFLGQNAAQGQQGYGASYGNPSPTPPPSSTPQKEPASHPFIVAFLILLILGMLGYGVWRYMPRLGTAQLEEEANRIAQASEKIKDIALHNVRQYTVLSSKAGLLLVLEGRIINNFRTPREMVKVEASLYDAEGNVLDTSRQLCGVLVSKLQMQIWDEDDIEAALGNEVEAFSRNVNIASGTSVPFMVVFFNPPASVKDYAVRVVEAHEPPAKE